MHAAFESNRILVTADRDFGQLIFVRQLPHGAIIRFVNMDSSKWCPAMTKILDLHLSDLASGALITVSLGRIRVRR
jgi:predicted nuclease of predicted toxin-antitoxin system